MYAFAQRSSLVRTRNFEPRPLDGQYLILEKRRFRETIDFFVKGIVAMPFNLHETEFYRPRRLRELLFIIRRYRTFRIPFVPRPRT